MRIALTILVASTIWCGAVDAVSTNNTEGKRGEMSESELTEKTKLPLALVASCIAAFVGGALWINNSLNRIDNRLAAMERQVNDRWSGADMRIWAMQLRMDNPTLKIPSTIQQP